MTENRVNDSNVAFHELRGFSFANISLGKRERVKGKLWDFKKLSKDGTEREVVWKSERKK